MPAGMNVRINPTGRHSETGEIVIGLAAPVANGDNAVAFDDQVLVVKRLAFAVEDCAGAKHDLLRRCERCRSQETSHELGSKKFFLHECRSGEISGNVL